MIEIEGLTKRFGPILAVDGVSFSVAEGEVLGFLGPNGAGKSTTMKMATGFLRPTSGRAAICGHDVAKEPIAARARLGYLPEGAPAYGDMTAEGFLRFVAEMRGFRGAEVAKRVERAVELTQIDTVLTQPVDTLSKGYKRRVGLAQALLHDPDVLIMDEPTDGLDPNQKHEVRSLIAEMATEKAIVISTHILEEVGAVCTRALVIAAGRVVADGTPAELEARSRHHNAVTLAVHGAKGDEVKTSLEALDGVAATEPAPTEGDRVAFTAIPANGAWIADKVAGLVRDKGWQADEMRVERGRLDDVFRDITRAG